MTDSAATAEDVRTGQSAAVWESMLAIADDELISSHTLAHLCDLAGPALEPMLAVLSYVQDDTGHSIRWYELVQGHYGRTTDELVFARQAGDFRCSALTEVESTDWYVVVGKNLLYKTADVARQRALLDAPVEEVRSTVARTMDEDRFHESFWRLWARQLLTWDTARFRATCVSLAADAPSLFELSGFWSAGEAAAVHESWARDMAGMLGVPLTDLVQGKRPHPPRGAHRDEFPTMVAAMQSVYRAYPGGVW